MTQRHLYFVFADPVDGQEEAFNDWYQNVHIPEVLQVPGFVACQRYRVSGEQRTADIPPPQHRYVAVYQVEGDPRTVLDALNAAMAAGRVNRSDLIRQPTASHLYTAVGDRVESTASR